MIGMKENQSTVNLNIPLSIITLGCFKVERGDVAISSTAWKREKALQLLQCLVTMRHQFLHKEQLIELLWPEVDPTAGDRDFKVALHHIQKVLEPDRPRRGESQFIQRQGLTYKLNLEMVTVDADQFETAIQAGNEASLNQPVAIAAYQQAVSLYQGDFLPARCYEDWTTFERERLQVLALGVIVCLAELYLDRAPLESIRLTQRALTLDPAWEDAYRVEMAAYVAQGNRPLAIRTYQRCATILRETFGLDPLPRTEAIYMKLLES